MKKTLLAALVLTAALTDGAAAQSQEAMRRAAALQTYADYITGDERAPEIGKQGSERVIVEFFDYRCGFCRMNYERVAELVEKDERIRVVYKPLPILDPVSGPKLSKLAATMAVAAQAEGDFSKYHDHLMRRRGPFTEELIVEAATQAGLSAEAIEKARTDEAIAGYLEEVATLAELLSIDGTPAYVIAGSVYRGAIRPDVMSAALDRAEATSR
ncbi:DsbA family protein [Parvularcula maris]|uniref:DsbA family protein n=1 Tax=Parvularcula maris TaxID=2965077 RepID=A0A9X2LDG2_9PROT|nr:DsbA family protein [Parvularcula maris]MCQ8186502.1 DsbA family protein [Parvularcula maris]